MTKSLYPPPLLDVLYMVDVTFLLVAPLNELVRNNILLWEYGQEKGFQSLPYSNVPNITNIYVSILFTGVEERINEFQEPQD